MTTITTDSGIEANPKRSFSLRNITRKQILAVALILVGAFILLRAPASMSSDVVTYLTLEPGSIDEIPSLAIPTLTFLIVSGTFFLLSGLAGLFAPAQFQRYATGMMIVSGILFVPAVVIGAAAGTSTNITTMLSESLRLATPLAIGAMAGLWCERSGVVNIAIEGMMLMSACLGFTVFFFLFPAMPGQTNLALFISVVAAIITGGLVAALHAWLSITFATDQIVSGTVINILALGSTSFIRREYLLSSEGGTITLPNIEIPILSDIPIIGQPIFNNQPIFYLMFLIIIGSHIMLFYTRWGVRMRAVGEHPSAADTLGINVNRVRWISVIIGGCIAGLAGAWFSLEATGRFVDGMTRGAGFIALAALIFGKWTPLGAFGGALVFGFSDALGTRLQIIDVDVPVQFLQMVPFVVTLVVLAGLIGRASAPKAIGIPYKKE